MGMAAPQSRLLRLTSRKSSIGLQLQGLSLEKTSLARDMQKVTRQYNDALNKKVLKWSNNAGVNYIDLSYQALMSPSVANNNVPYFISDSNGKIVLDAKYADIARKISPNGSPAGSWSTNSERYNILAEVINRSDITAEKIKNWESSQNDVEDAYNVTEYYDGRAGYYQSSANSKAKMLSFATLASEIFGEKNCSKDNNITVNLNTPMSEEELRKSLKTQSITSLCTLLGDGGYLTAQSQLESFKTTLLSKLDAYYSKNVKKGDNVTTQYSMRESEYNALKNIIQSYTLDNLYPFNSKKVKDLLEEEYSGSLFYEISKESMQEKLGGPNAIVCTKLGATYEDITSDIMGKFAAALKSNAENNTTNDTLEDAYQTDASGDIVKLAYREQGWLNDIQTRDQYEELCDKANEVYSSVLDESNQIFDAEQETLIKFYDSVFQSICENGWVENNQVRDSEYLNQMLQNNRYFITSQKFVEGVKSYVSCYDYGFGLADKAVNEDYSSVLTACQKHKESGVLIPDEYTYTTDLASNFNKIFSVSDSNAQSEALSNYEYQKSIINSKESRIDQRMKNLETEQSAINQMMQSIQSILNENTEKLNIFS